MRQLADIETLCRQVVVYQSVLICQPLASDSLRIDHDPHNLRSTPTTTRQLDHSAELPSATPPIPSQTSESTYLCCEEVKEVCIDLSSWWICD